MTVVSSKPRDAVGQDGDVAVDVRRLTKKFAGRTAVDDVSFQVRPGEVFGFLGPNGAGKTTTVRMLSTLITATSGAAMVAGIPVTPGREAEIRRRVAVLPESPGLYRRLTVTENLEYFARLYGLPDRPARITAALAAVRLADRATTPCGQLSKGLRQRVALARTLLNDPAVMFLDEPTSGLDPVAAHEVLGLIGALRERGVTVFLTTHRLDEAERLCDRVAIMSTRLRTIGRPDELRRTLFRRTLAVATAAPLDRPDQVFGGLPGVESWQADVATGDGAGPAGYQLAVSDPVQDAPAVIRALVTAGADVVSAGEPRASLGDVYLELVGAGPEGQAPEDRS
ncbi:MAG: ABC transporter ATP-binding protein [Actinobacteria bacterium]|nr:ABC transporter ATP-binding protein [Actinomycetota bacterium]